MKAPPQCPKCKEKRKWVMVVKANRGDMTGAAVGVAAGSKSKKAAAGADDLIGNTVDRGKKIGIFGCRNCGFSYEYEL